MKARGKRREAPLLPACSDPRLGRLLAAYDALDADRRGELGRHVASCPVCSPRWEVLTAAETWLENARRPAQACPAAEDLYDYGCGPGHGPLAAFRRSEIEHHLEGCAPCRGFLGTLEAPIPVPWIGGMGDSETLEGGPVREQDLGLEPPPRRFPLRRLLPRFEPESWRTWVPAMAAAAALFLLARAAFLDGAGSTSVAKGTEGVGSVPFDFPDAPVLRGMDGRGASPLHFPRDRVLAGDGATFHPLVFELEPQEGAGLYRIELRRHEGGAFEVGEEIGRLEGAGPVLDAAHLVLDPGHYTWEAWVDVHGLERFLGERDFEIDVDEDLRAKWDELEELDEPARSEQRLLLLHERGYLGDARAFAHGMPASEARDRYLDAVPGR